MQYQVQEMLRIERIFEPEGIADELGAYNPLIPDGSNWKATLLIEYPDADERRGALARLRGVEDRCWVQVGRARTGIMRIADEDLERENDEKTSAVHFLRFELHAGAWSRRCEARRRRRRSASTIRTTRTRSIRCLGAVARIARSRIWPERARRACAASC